MQLNESQEIAASFKTGSCYTTACPGSGKSRLLVERAARLVENGANPNSLCVITFTNKAAKSLVERLDLRLGGDVAKRMFIGTFHRLSLKILRKHGHYLGYTEDMTIIDPDEQVSLIMQIARQFEMEITKPEAKKIAFHVNDYRENLQTSDDLGDRFDNIDKPEYYKVALEYERKLLANNQIDFTGMLSQCVSLLKNHQTVLDQIQKYLVYLMCDEGQDCNGVQYYLVRLLMSHNNNIFIVADECQSIYAFRGSKSSNITDFINKHNPTIYTLNKNYRSTPTILRHAELLINHNPVREPVKLVTDNEDGPPAVCRSYPTDQQEADGVAKTIQSLVASGECSYRDNVVLYRMNSMSRAIEMAMIANKIPHVVIGNFSFFDRKECLDAMAILRFMVNRKDGIAFQRFANKPTRGLGDSSIARIELYAEAHNVDILQAMKEMTTTSKMMKDGMDELVVALDFDTSSMNIGEVLNKAVTNLKYKDYLDNEDADSAVDRWDNIQELIRDSAKFSEENGPSIAKYLEQIMLITSNDKSAEGSDMVSIMSSHGVKGLEFQNVFLIGAEQGIMPHRRAVEETPDGINEERRIFYVSITRPHKRIYVSWCQKRQEGYGRVSYRKSTPSQFLFEAGFLKNNSSK